MHYKKDSALEEDRLAEVPVEDSIKVVRKISWECSCAAYLTDWNSIMQIHTTDDDVNGGAREDDYDLTQQLSSDILQTIEISKIVEIGILAFL
ncbi:hypothetical protein RhiirA4_461485 [Rhizophagus irregularis]|uniref:Uncharacterized protein n=1 Tax=Rhizophagus irregularis TaxID=588596 RepID=A0A2I1GIY5_9GLOM|nr:hypothetical protein RhiirA4_461485 [Rhizophagus irregularis]